MTNTRETLIAAVRADKKVGRGSCASIDECFSDDELWDDLLCDCKTVEEALKECYESEGLWLEKGLNQRCGEDDDPQLAAWQEWREDR